MWPRHSKKLPYIPISEFESDEEDINTRGTRLLLFKSRFFVFTFIVIACSVCLVVGYFWGNTSQDPLLGVNYQHLPSSPRCTTLSWRREWRSLSQSEQRAYIRAVKCLTTKLTQVREEGALYDDFPYIHSKFGNYCEFEKAHGAAAFLPWHRYLLHIYENTLRDQCGYTGSLSYWDWTLDWEDLAHSPVFSHTRGFGGDGDLTGEESVGHGRCVTSGPFANFSLPLYNGNDHDHCLSRSFEDENRTRGRLSGEDVRPETIEALLRENDYEAFCLALEHKSHNAIPNGIGGDVLKFTAPNDPLFFLHHSQLDRIWWMWQHIDQRERLGAYVGIARHGSEERASVADVLPMGGLAEDRHVADVMSTESDLLCYRYL